MWAIHAIHVIHGSTRGGRAAGSVGFVSFVLKFHAAGGTARHAEDGRMASWLRVRLSMRQGERPVCRLNHTQRTQGTQSRSAGVQLTRSSWCTQSQSAGARTARPHPCCCTLAVSARPAHPQGMGSLSPSLAPRREWGAVLDFHAAGEAASHAEPGCWLCGLCVLCVGVSCGRMSKQSCR